MKRKKRAAHASPSKKQPRGFDYGCLPHAMALSSFEFPRHLSTASVDAVAYGSEWSDVVDRTLPTISLVAQRGDELAKAFEEFHAWSQMTDPDSVEIIIVFRNDGGYVLAISPEYSRLRRRCLGFDRAHRAVVFGPTWIKPIDSVHPMLRSLRKHYSAPIAPFLFQGVRYIGPESALTSLSPSEVSQIPGLQPLLKFEITFIDEDNVTPNSTAWIALRAESEQPLESSSGLPIPEPGDIAKQRIKALRHHFPVTLERIRRSLSVTSPILRLAESGVRPWQIEQALCNLVLSAEMGRGAHYSGLSARKADRNIIRAITSRYETADGRDLQAFVMEDVSTQVVADGNALLRYLKRPKCRDFAEIKVVLQAVSALDAPIAVKTPTECGGSS